MLIGQQQIAFLDFKILMRQAWWLTLRVKALERFEPEVLRGVRGYLLSPRLV